VVKHVVDQVKSWAKWFNILSIRNAQPGIELQFTLKGSQTRDPMARVGRPDMGVVEGETVEATLTNNSTSALYVAMLDLSSDGSISVVYPEVEGSSEVLQPDKVLTRTLTTFVPKGRSVVTDILKVFASYKPIDLSPLSQSAIKGGFRSGELDPLQALLMDSTTGTRGVLNTRLTLGAWTTTQRVLVVKRKRS